jgi:hypothetical protein
MECVIISDKGTHVVPAMIEIILEKDGMLKLPEGHEYYVGTLKELKEYALSKIKYIEAKLLVEDDIKIDC